jgi:hypothetical protein
LLYNYVNAGDTVTMKWHVTGSFGQALANQAVTLTDHGDGPDLGTWTGSLSGKTDANGDVTFTLVNTNTAGGTRPTDLTSVDVANNQEYNALLPYTRFVLVIGSDVIVKPSINQTTDFSDLIVVPPAGYVPPAGPTPTATSPTVDTPDTAALTSVSGLAAPLIDDSINGVNWFLGQYFNGQDSWFEGYVSAGSTVTEHWHLTGDHGQVLANTPVTFVLHHGGTDLNFTTPGAVNFLAQGTTDANGDVSFDVTNTDTAANAGCPANMTQVSDSTAAGSMVWSGNDPFAANEGTYGFIETTLIIGKTDSINASATDSITSSKDWGNSTEVTALVHLLVVPADCKA